MPFPVNALIKTTFPIDLTYSTAWSLREKFKPGPYIPNPNIPKEFEAFGHILRGKINSAILQFESSFTKTVSLMGPVHSIKTTPIEINRNEGWVLDSVLDYDGHDGSHTGLLLQIFRGLEELGVDPTLDF